MRRWGSKNGKFGRGTFNKPRKQEGERLAKRACENFCGVLDRGLETGWTDLWLSAVRASWALIRIVTSKNAGWSDASSGFGKRKPEEPHFRQAVLFEQELWKEPTQTHEPSRFTLSSHNCQRFNTIDFFQEITEAILNTALPDALSSIGLEWFLAFHWVVHWRHYRAMGLEPDRFQCISSTRSLQCASNLRQTPEQTHASNKMMHAVINQSNEKSNVRKPLS